MFIKGITSSAFLFIQWPTNTLTGLVLGMLASVVMAIFFESLHFIANKVPNLNRKPGSSLYNKVNLGIMSLRSLLHIMRVLIGYLLMLGVSTTNIWIIVSIVIGGGIGYFLLRPWHKKQMNKNQVQNDNGEVNGPLLSKESVL